MLRDYETLSMCACMCAFVTFLHKPLQSFICKDIFTKFAENKTVKGIKILCSFKKNGHHSQLFKNHKDVLKLEILQLA